MQHVLTIAGSDSGGGCRYSGRPQDVRGARGVWRQCDHGGHGSEHRTGRCRSRPPALDRSGADRRGRIGHSSRRREDRHARDGGDRRGGRRRDRALAPAAGRHRPRDGRQERRQAPRRGRDNRGCAAGCCPSVRWSRRIATKPRCLRACQCARDEAREAARRIAGSGSPAVVIKGGHFEGHTSSTCCSTGATSPRSRASASTRRARTAPAARSPPRLPRTSPAGVACRTLSKGQPSTSQAPSATRCRSGTVTGP